VEASWTIKQGAARVMDGVRIRLRQSETVVSSARQKPHHPNQANPTNPFFASIQHKLNMMVASLIYLLRGTTPVSGGRIMPLTKMAFVNTHYSSRYRSSSSSACTARKLPILGVSSPPISSRSSTKQQTIEADAVIEPFMINLLTLPLPELETLLVSWGYPAYRGKQIQNHIFNKGITNINDMVDLPKQLRILLTERTTIGSLHLEVEQISTDGTIKRAYKLYDGQMIESVLMPYDDGRHTACISSQAGCAMGCVFCATGQMGFARQLTSDEIYEQVARFAMELRSTNERLSNVVMMGMGEPLANYRNVISAIRRMNTELGIGARKITVSTVGVVPNIKKLMNEDVQVRLALSLHCATDEERTALLPANRRYGGLDELMSTIREYITVKKSRVTFEWALIEGKNDSKDVARTLGRLLQRHGIRPDMAHVNLIPLNPTGGFAGGPSQRNNVQNFVNVLDKEFGITATPRMRRGIDIDAGCGQLKASVKKKEDLQQKVMKIPESGSLPIIGVYEDDEEEMMKSDGTLHVDNERHHVGVEVLELRHGSLVEFKIDDEYINLDDEEAEDFVDPAFEDEFELAEAERLIALVKGVTPHQEVSPSILLSTDTLPHVEHKVKSTTITDEDAIRTAKRRRKKLLKQLDSIQTLKDMEASGKVLNQEQLDKISKEKEWTIELESVEHNLM
jgi:23S rRNA (adenine2503-C2)-methyltransferase